MTQPPAHINSITNKAEFEKVFRLYYKPLVGYAIRYLKSQEEAEEVVQEVFFKLWNKADSLNIKTSVKSYLFGAVRNSCLNAIQHQKTVQEYVDYTRYTTRSELTETPLEVEELQQQINTAINKLPEKCKEIFLLSRMEEKKYKEIAEELGISIKTVENQMGKALKILREELGQYLPLLLFTVQGINFLMEAIGVNMS